MHKITQAVRPEVQAAITLVKETFSKLGCSTAEGLGFVLAVESAGGVQPAVPLVNMIKKVAGTVEAIEERGVSATKESLEIIAKNQLENSFTPKPVHYVPNVPKFCQSTVAGKFQTIEYELTTVRRTVDVGSYTSQAMPTESQIYAFAEQWAPGKDRLPVFDWKGTKVIGWKTIELAINQENGQRVITTKSFRFPAQKQSGGLAGEMAANLEEYIIEQPIDKPIPTDTTKGFNWKTNLHVKVLKE